MSLTYKFFLLTFFTCAAVCSQVEEIQPQDYIKTINFSKSPQSKFPIFKLGEAITLEFDVLNGNEDDFYYEIKHYNKDWTPSTLITSEYLEGFNEQRIREYQNSFNTYQIYSHYTLTIPNEQTRGLKKSGNYIITIYNEYDEVEFTRKFIVYEELVNVGVDIKRSRDVSAIKEKQTVDIVVNSNNFTFNNPKQSVKAVIIQNNNLKTAISNIFFWKNKITSEIDLYEKYIDSTTYEILVLNYYFEDENGNKDYFETNHYVINRDQFICGTPGLTNREKQRKSGKPYIGNITKIECDSILANWNLK